jgi:hypothetical protein
MRKLFKKGLILMLPFGLWCLFILAVDPSNMFLCSPLGIPDDVKEKTAHRGGDAMPRDWSLYKISAFDHAPTKVVLLGDSRAFSLPTEPIAERLGEPVFNFGIPGGNVSTSADMFWFAVSRVKLEKVYFQVSFHNSGPYQSVAKDALAIHRNKALYFVDHHVAAAALSCVSRWLSKTNGAVRLGDRKQIFADLLQLQKSLFDFGVNDPAAFNQLSRIASYCRSNSIHLVIFNMPMHNTIHDMIRQRALDGDYRSFRSRVAELGEFCDFDAPQTISLPDEAFRDPLHVTAAYSTNLSIKLAGNPAAGVKVTGDR